MNRTATKTGVSAVWHDSDKSWELREFPLPELEPDAIQVRVRATSVCGSDLHIWRGDGLDPKAPPRDPFVFGHEMMGEVAALGRKVTTDSLRRPLKEGDRVAYSYFFPCAKCYNCIRGEFGACKFRMGRRPLSEWPVCNGGFAQYYYLRAPQYVFKLPDALSDAAAAPINCALAQVFEALHLGGVKLGDNVVIQGAGGLGINACAVARDLGASKVVAIDGQKARLELARQCGATHTIDLNEYATPEARIDRVMQLTDGIGADKVVEVVGFPAAVEEGLRMVRMRGIYLEIGHISPNSFVRLDVSKLVSNQVRFFGIQHYDPWIIPNSIDFLMRTRDRYPLTKVISHEFPLEKIDEAFKTAEWLGRKGGSEVTRAIVTP
jgi:threonine dehydrogenase-like Zn-dependent dehydrogenase